MSTGYQVIGPYVNGDVISATLFNNDFGAIAAAMHQTTGHDHDGTTGGGTPIAKIGDIDFNNKIEIDGTNNKIKMFIEVGGSPTEVLNVSENELNLISSSAPQLTLINTDNIVNGDQLLGAINFYNSDPSNAGPHNVVTIEARAHHQQGYGGDLYFKINDGTNAEPETAMEISAQGYVFIGNDDINLATSSTQAGVTMGFGPRMLQVSTANGAPAAFNRNTGYGEIVKLYTQGNELGVLEAHFNDLVISNRRNDERVILEVRAADGTAHRIGVEPDDNVAAFKPLNADSDDYFDLGSTTERFRNLYLSNAGYFETGVSIGSTSTPAYELDVTGSAQITGGDLILRSDSSDADTQYIRFENHPNFVNRTAYIRADYFSDAAGNGTELAFGSNNHDTEADTDSLVIDREGNVGIGANPYYKLDVAGDSVSARLKSQTGNTNLYLHTLASDGRCNLYFGGPSPHSTNKSGAIEYNHSTHIMSFDTDSTERMSIDSTGDVTIKNDLIVEEYIRPEKDIVASGNNVFRIKNNNASTNPSAIEMYSYVNGLNDIVIRSDPLRSASDTEKFRVAGDRINMSNINYASIENGLYVRSITASGGSGNVDDYDEYSSVIHAASGTDKGYSFQGSADSAERGCRVKLEQLADATTDVVIGSIAFLGKPVGISSTVYSKITSTVTDAAGTEAELKLDSNTLYATGKVGIGTSSPSGKIHSVAADSQVAVMAGGDVSDPLYPAFGFDGQIGSNEGRGSGMYLPADGTLAFSTAGSGRMLIDSSGNVGIGTDSPDQKLQVDGNIRIGDTAIGIDDDEDYNITTGGQLTIHANDSGENVDYISLNLSCGNSSGSQNEYSRISCIVNDDEKMRIDSSGNVGINTTNPAHPLDVKGNVNVTYGTDPMYTTSPLLTSITLSIAEITDLSYASQKANVGLAPVGSWNNARRALQILFNFNGDGNATFGGWTADDSLVISYFVADNYSANDISTFNSSLPAIIDGTYTVQTTIIDDILDGDYDYLVDYKVGINASPATEALDVGGTIKSNKVLTPLVDADTVETRDIIVYETQASAVSPLLTADRTPEELADLSVYTLYASTNTSALPDYQKALLDFSGSTTVFGDILSAEDVLAVMNFITLDTANNYTTAEQDAYETYRDATPYVYQSTIIQDIKRGDYDYLIAPAKVGINTETPASALDVIGDISVSGNITSDLGLNFTPTQGIEMRAGDSDGIEMHWWAQTTGTTVATDGEQTKRFHITNSGVHVGDDVTGTYTAGDLQNNQDIDFGFLVGRESDNFGSNNVGIGFDLMFDTNSASNFAQGSVIDLHGAATNCVAFGGNLKVGTELEYNTGSENSFIGGVYAATEGDNTFTWAEGALAGSTIYRALNNGKGSVLFGKQGQIDADSEYSLLGGKIGNNPSAGWIEPSLTNSSYAFSWGFGNVVDGSNGAVVCGSFNSADGAADCLVTGSYNSTLSDNSFVAGLNNSVTNVDTAIAIGKNNTVEGDFSVAMGQDNNTLGVAGVCLGRGLKTPLFLNNGNYQWDNYSAVVGAYNEPTEKYYTASDNSTWVEDHRFVVGTGTSAFAKDNGFVVAVPTSDFSGVIMPALAASTSHANDTVAKAAGVPVGGLYHTNGVVKVVL